MGTICRFVFLLFLYFALSCSAENTFSAIEIDYLQQAEKNGREANEALRRCRNYVIGWLAHADPSSGLIPRNLTKDTDIWNASDAAADNYPFMVLTCALTDRDMFAGQMYEILESEKKLTSRAGRIPDTYSFSKKGFTNPEINMDRLIFGGSEYVKDGLLPLTEWLGPSPWADRMIGITDDIWLHASYPSTNGNIPSYSNEVNGEMLQILSRLYWMTGEGKYLDWAYRLADFYLIEKPLINKDENIRLRDHGCEIVAGLSEIYLISHYTDQQKKETYKQPIYALFDRVLQMGRNEHGMLYNWFNPLTGQHDDMICDTWGYNYNAFYTLFLIDKSENYRQAVLKALLSLDQYYRDYQWEGQSADGYADAIEGAINLYNRESLPSVADWIDSQIKRMWSIQKADGVIEGWHGDGNFARTSIMYALWKTKGLWIDPWREDVQLGAVERDDVLYLTVQAAMPWEGKIMFDRPRYRDFLNLPLDYPRINQFPQWFSLNTTKTYTIFFNDKSDSQNESGKSLSTGLTFSLQAGQVRALKLVAD